jgi:hypothetical protein
MTETQPMMIALKYSELVNFNQSSNWRRIDLKQEIKL